MKRAYSPRLLKSLMVMVMAVILTAGIAPVSNMQEFYKSTGQAFLIPGEAFLKNEIVFSPIEPAPTEELEPTENTTLPETTEDLSEVAAYLIDGKSVPLTSEQLSDLEKRIYACQSQEELDEVMSPLQYYNNGIDYGRFEWYWETLDIYYTDEQITMMRNNKDQQIKLPNLIGMKAEDAYQCSIDQGFIVRIYYQHSYSSDLPIGYVYHQEFPAGTEFNSNACVFLKLQAPKEITSGGYSWFPGDTDSDILAIAQEIRDSNEFMIYAPYVIGMKTEEAKSLLEAHGFYNVRIYYTDFANDGYEPGCCYYQSPMYCESTSTIFLGIQKDYIVEVPNVVGMSEHEAFAAFRALGLGMGTTYVNSPQPGAETGYCIGQSIEAGTLTEEKTIYIKIQFAPQTCTPTPTPTPIPTPTLTPTPTPTLESEDWYVCPEPPVSESTAS